MGQVHHWIHEICVFCIYSRVWNWHIGVEVWVVFYVFKMWSINQCFTFHAFDIAVLYAYTVRCHYGTALYMHTRRCYNAISFLQNFHKRCPIAHPLGRAMRCLLWVQALIHILPHSLQWCMQYHVILYRFMMASDCISARVITELGCNLKTSKLLYVIKILITPTSISWEYYCV